MALTSKGIEPNFLYHFISSQFQAINTNTRGTGIPHVDPEFFWNLDVPIAPLNEQRRIVAKLEELLARVEASQKRLAKIPVILKRFRQSVLAAACSGRLTADWREDNATQINPIQIIREVSQRRQKVFAQNLSEALSQGLPKPRRPKNLELQLSENQSGAEIPDKWVWTSFEDAASPKRYAMSSGPFGSSLGRKDYQDNGIPVVRGQNIQSGKFCSDNFVYISPEKAGELARSSASPGDIVIVAVGSSGQAAIVPPEIPLAILSQNCNKITVDDKFVLPEFVNLVLQVEMAIEQMRDKTTDTARPFLSLTNLKSLLLPVPPFAEQQEIVRRVEALFKVADQIEARYQKAKTHVDRLTQSILAKAFRGELVPQDENDEPASLLLERIRAARATVAATPRRTPAPRQPRTTYRQEPESLAKATEPAATYSESSIPETILAAMQPGREYSRADLAEPLNLSPALWNHGIRQLKEQGLVSQAGEKRGARYRLA